MVKPHIALSLIAVLALSASAQPRSAGAEAQREAFGRFVESRVHFGEHLLRVVFLAGFDRREIALLQSLEAVERAGIAAVAARALAHPAFGRLRIRHKIK